MEYFCSSKRLDKLFTPCDRRLDGRYAIMRETQKGAICAYNDGARMRPQYVRDVDRIMINKTCFSLVDCVLALLRGKLILFLKHTILYALT